eukprot:TRINITY_DN80153_c0_g1_i1.p1 TRINITY_DN80153_c0_g1~~TRINITY_DN80153_c0_g1_i1.p1  ORF type:complete len:686 (-),score=140.58 TRINITY_DN80153_c0_g1_i1:71-2128(-)
MEKGDQKEITRQKSAEEDNLGQLFMSWIKDTHETPTREHFLRLQEAMEKGCNEKIFSMRSQRLGVNCAITIARILDRSPVEKLDLYENVIRDHGVQALTQLLRDSRFLTYLNLGGNDIGPQGSVYIAALLPTNKKLKSLILGSEENDLHTNKIDSDAGKAIAEALQKNKTLKLLDLNRNPLGASSQEVFAAFGRVLERNKTLTTVKLGSTQMTTASAILCIKSLLQNSVLETLDFHDNSLQQQIGDALAELFTQKHARGLPNTLQTLLLHDNPKIGPKGMLSFFRAVRNTGAPLAKLNLTNTAIADEGVSALAEALVSNTSLTHLELADNDITEEGCVALCVALHSNSTLKVLNLSRNKLKDEGACALATTLETNLSISHLEIASSRIADRGVIALGVALAHNPTLQHLKIGNNNISDEAGHAFAELIERNGKLLAIDIRGNQVSHGTLLRIKKVVRQNKSLRDGEAPAQLHQEVIRLHYQQYKLQEANQELKEHQRARLELQEQADKAERDALVEKENTSKRSKEIVEKITMVDNFCDDLRQKRKAKEDEVVKIQHQFDQETKALQEKLKIDIALREQRQQEADDLEAEHQRLVKDRETRLAELKERIKSIRADKENWIQKNKEYKAQAQQSQEMIVEYEKRVKERQAALAEERRAKAKAPKKTKEQRKADSDALIESLLTRGD